MLLIGWILLGVGLGITAIGIRRDAAWATVVATPLLLVALAFLSIATSG